MEQATPTPALTEEKVYMIQDSLIKDMSPLEDALNELGHMATDTSKITALELTVVMRRAEAFLQALQLRTRAFANAGFIELQAASPAKKQWSVYNGLGVVKPQAPGCNWVYPNAINEMERRLREAKKVAQEDETATKLEPTRDPNSTATFSVELSDQFGV